MSEAHCERSTHHRCVVFWRAGIFGTAHRVDVIRMERGHVESRVCGMPRAWLLANLLLPYGESSMIALRSYAWFRSLRWGRSNPGAVLWWLCSPFGQFIIIDEYRFQYAD